MFKTAAFIKLSEPLHWMLLAACVALAAAGFYNAVRPATRLRERPSFATIFVMGVMGAAGSLALLDQEMVEA